MCFEATERRKVGRKRGVRFPLLLSRGVMRRPSIRIGSVMGHYRPDWQVPGSWPVREPLQLFEPVEHHVDLARGWRFETTNQHESATVGGDVI